MRFLAAVLFSVAVSMDGLAAGWAYGLARVVVPWYSRVVVNLITIAIVGMAMLGGAAFNRLFVTPRVPVILGTILLFVVGGGMAVRGWINGKPRVVLDPGGLLWTLRVRPLGLIIQVLRQPLDADVDHSGKITVGEAAILGLALAADAFGAGVGAGVTGYWPAITPLFAGLFQFAFFTAGLWAGQRPMPDRWQHCLQWLPGLIIVILGVIRMI